MKTLKFLIEKSNKTKDHTLGILLFFLLLSILQGVFFISSNPSILQLFKDILPKFIFSFIEQINHFEGLDDVIPVSLMISTLAMLIYLQFAIIASFTYYLKSTYPPSKMLKSLNQINLALSEYNDKKKVKPERNDFIKINREEFNIIALKSDKRLTEFISALNLFVSILILSFLFLYIEISRKNTLLIFIFLLVLTIYFLIANNKLFKAIEITNENIKRFIKHEAIITPQENSDFNDRIVQFYQKLQIKNLIISIIISILSYALFSMINLLFNLSLFFQATIITIFLGIIMCKSDEIIEIFEKCYDKIVIATKNLYKKIIKFLKKDIVKKSVLFLIIFTLSYKLIPSIILKESYRILFLSIIIGLFFYNLSKKINN